MPNLKVYYCNSKFNKKDYTNFFDDVAVVLKDKYTAQIFPSNEHIMFVDREGVRVKFMECEMLIDVDDGDSYRFLSFCDTDPGITQLLEKRNNSKDILLHGQYNSPNSRFYNRQNSFNCKISGFIYSSFMDYVPDLLEQKYLERQKLTSFINKLYWRGNIDPMGRMSAKLLLNNEHFYGGYGIETQKYFNELINYNIGLSIPGIGEMCYRDIEYLALGMPYIKCEYDTNLYPKLLPNFHYIAVDRITKRLEDERDGGQEYVDAYIKRFLEVKDDRIFLNFISKNAREYYEKYLHKNTRVQHTLNLIGL